MPAVALPNVIMLVEEPTGKKMGQGPERLRKPLEQDGATQHSGVGRKGEWTCSSLSGSAEKTLISKSQPAILRSLELPRNEPPVAFL